MLDSLIESVLDFLLAWAAVRESASRSKLAGNESMVLTTVA